ncbi:MAG: aspartate carbamoyltransferase regulatory subunit [Dorea sp.]|jgi:aspartate carbamoyltransferase regulatory subunit|nr:aspartate carbamoyltransferase regulatory subunit [Dorea sp.]
MIENTLTVGSISEGFVLDHIQAGKSMDIYKYLNLDKLDCCVAIIKNAKSNKMGKKDIMKIECPIDFMDLDVLAFIDHNITINIIKDQKIVEKKALQLPKQIRNVIHCRNPRCITSIEQGLEHVFILTDPETETYRCKYCEEKYDGRHRRKK